MGAAPAATMPFMKLRLFVFGILFFIFRPSFVVVWL